MMDPPLAELLWEVIERAKSGLKAEARDGRLDKIQRPLMDVLRLPNALLGPLRSRPELTVPAPHFTATAAPFIQFGRDRHGSFRAWPASW